MGFWQKQVHVQRLGCMKSEVCLGKCIWVSDTARTCWVAGGQKMKLHSWVSGTKSKGFQIWDGARTLDTKVLEAWLNNCDGGGGPGTGFVSMMRFILSFIEYLLRAFCA